MPPGTRRRIQSGNAGESVQQRQNQNHRTERLLGRPVAVQHLAPGEPVTNLPEFMAGLLPAFETFDTQLDTRELAETFGVKLTPIDAVFARLFAGSGTV